MASLPSISENSAVSRVGLSVRNSQAEVKSFRLVANRSFHFFSVFGEVKNISKSDFRYGLGTGLRFLNEASRSLHPDWLFKPFLGFFAPAH